MRTLIIILVCVLSAGACQAEGKIGKRITRRAAGKATGKGLRRLFK